MSDDTVHQMLIDSINRFDKNQTRLFDKLDEQHHTLGRLTTTVELHQKYSENLEKEQKIQRRTLDDIDSELGTIKDHVKEVKIWMKIIQPTKGKLAIIAVVASLLGGNEVAKTPIIKKLIKGYFVSPGPSKVTFPPRGTQDQDASSTAE